jgi:hypothetical protein
VQLEPVAFERLGLDRLPVVAHNLLLRAERQPEDGQPAVLLPEHPDRAADALARLRKTAFLRLSASYLRARRCKGHQECQNEQRHDNHS